MKYWDKLATVFNTVKHLRLVQIVYQIKNRMTNRDSFNNYWGGAVSVKPISLYIPELDDRRCFESQEILDGKITLLNHIMKLNDNWHDDAAPHLVNFELHYFRYAIDLAVEYIKTGNERYRACIRDLYKSWQKIKDINVDAKHPYTTSLRIINLLVAASLLNDVELIISLYPQYRYLIKHQEKSLLGNHYFENLKTIVICSVVFGEDVIFQKYARVLLKEIETQILPDGVHYELSLTYHKIVLGGIIRVAYVLQQAKVEDYKRLLPIIEKMVDALASLENGMGKTPLFNDVSDMQGEGKRLVNAIERLFEIRPKDKKSFPDSGYYKLYDDDIAVMFDAGKIAPDYMPGHGHCDCLSFELSVGSTPLFVNSGTYQYQGDKRVYFRSTKAHNTVVVGDREQSECWGEHRVARRISHIEAKRDGQIIMGRYKSYYGDWHTRILSLTDGALTVLDEIRTTATMVVHSYLHIGPDFTAIGEESCIRITRNDITVCTVHPIESAYSIHTTGDLSNYAPAFGVLLQAICLEFIWQADSKQHGYIVKFV